MNTKYDWSNVPKEVNWIAMDCDEWVYGYGKKPECGNDGFFGLSYTGFLLPPCEHKFLGNWRESLEERPHD